MNKMTEEELLLIKLRVIEIMRKTVSSEYSEDILNHKDEATGNTLLEDIICNILETSAREDEKFYNEDDIKLAIGRELVTRLGVEV